MIGSAACLDASLLRNGFTLAYLGTLGWFFPCACRSHSLTFLMRSLFQYLEHRIPPVEDHFTSLGFFTEFCLNCLI